MITIELQVDDESLAKKVMQACKLLMGVTSVKVRKNNNAKKCDITKTDAFREAMDDVKNGRIYQAESVDDMFKQILG